MQYKTYFYFCVTAFDLYMLHIWFYNEVDNEAPHPRSFPSRYMIWNKYKSAKQ